MGFSIVKAYVYLEFIYDDIIQYTFLYPDTFMSSLSDGYKSKVLYIVQPFPA